MSDDHPLCHNEFPEVSLFFYKLNVSLDLIRSTSLGSTYHAVESLVKDGSSHRCWNI